MSKLQLIGTRLRLWARLARVWWAGRNVDPYRTAIVRARILLDLPDIMEELGYIQAKKAKREEEERKARSRRSVVLERFPAPFYCDALRRKRVETLTLEGLEGVVLGEIQRRRTDERYN